MENLTKLSLLIAAVLSVGCSSTQENPSTYGTGTDDLKKSPCSECNLEPFYIDGKWLTSSQLAVVHESPVEPLLLASQDTLMTGREHIS